MWRGHIDLVLHLRSGVGQPYFVSRFIFASRLDFVSFWLALSTLARNHSALVFPLHEDLRDGIGLYDASLIIMDSIPIRSDGCNDPGAERAMCTCQRADNRPRPIVSTFGCESICSSLYRPFFALRLAIIPVFWWISDIEYLPGTHDIQGIFASNV